jgi:hypothetical protein
MSEGTIKNCSRTSTVPSHKEILGSDGVTINEGKYKIKGKFYYKFLTKYILFFSFSMHLIQQHTSFLIPSGFQLGLKPFLHHMFS